MSLALSKTYRLLLSKTLLFLEAEVQVVSSSVAGLQS